MSKTTYKGETRYMEHIIKEYKDKGKEVIVISTKTEFERFMSGIGDVKNTILIIEDIEKLTNKNK